MSSTTITEPSDAALPGRLVSPRVIAVLAALVLAVVGLIGYGIGHSSGTRPHVLTGRAYAGPDQASVRAGGRVYGFAVSPNSMDWYDAHGGLHEGGIPPCLQHRPGYARIRFGWADAHGPDGASWRVVTWVQCVPQPG